MSSEDRSLCEAPGHDRQDGYRPFHPPVFRGLWRLRQGAVPSLCTCFTCRSPADRRKTKKSSRKLKTPRMMLPTLLA